MSVLPLAARLNGVRVITAMADTAIYIYLLWRLFSMNTSVFHSSFWHLLLQYDVSCSRESQCFGDNSLRAERRFVCMVRASGWDGNMYNIGSTARRAGLCIISLTRQADEQRLWSVVGAPLFDFRTVRKGVSRPKHFLCPFNTRLYLLFSKFKCN
jgi:hypothetical protein